VRRAVAGGIRSDGVVGAVTVDIADDLMVDTGIGRYRRRARATVVAGAVVVDSASDVDVDVDVDRAATVVTTTAMVFESDPESLVPPPQAVSNSGTTIETASRTA